MKLSIYDIPILYINLEKDKNRNKEFIDNLNTLELRNIKRIEGILGSDLNKENIRNELSKYLGIPKEKLKPSYYEKKTNFNCYARDIDHIMPKVGCYLSHLKCLDYAIKNNYKSVLILEDDAIILPSIKDKISIPDNSDIIYFGGFFDKKKDVMINKSDNLPYIKIDNKIFKIFGTYGYYLPNNNKIKELYNIFFSIYNNDKSQIPKHTNINQLKQGDLRSVAYPADRMIINSLQKFNNTFILDPILISHNSNFESNIGKTKKYIKQQQALPVCLNNNYLNNQLQLLDKLNKFKYYSKGGGKLVTKYDKDQKNENNIEMNLDIIAEDENNIKLLSNYYKINLKTAKYYYEINDKSLEKTINFLNIL